MAKKLACMLALVLGFGSFVYALDLLVGIEGGYTHNILNTSTGNRAFTSYNDRGGFLAGVPILLSFNQNLALGTGLRYIQKNYQYERDFLDGYPMHSDYTNGFLQIPVFADISADIAALRLSFDLGAALGFWLHSNREGVMRVMYDNPYDPDYVQMESFNESVAFDNTRDNRFDAALFAGIGVKFTIKSFTPFITAQFHYGLTDLQNNYMENQVPRYNNTITVQMGVLYSLFKKSK